MKGLLLVSIGACSYGCLGVFAKLGFAEQFTVAQIVGSQVLIGTALLAIVVLIRKIVLPQKTHTPPQNKNYILKLLLLGCSAGFTNIFYYTALSLLPVSIGVLLLFQFTWISLLIESIAHKKYPSITKILAIILILVGTIFASGFLYKSYSSFSTKGIVFGLLSALSYAITIFANGHIATKIDPYNKTILLSIGALIVCCIAFPPIFLIDGSLLHGLLKWGLLMGLFSIFIPNQCFAIGMPLVGVGIGAIISAMELPVAIITAAIFLNEKIVYYRWAGVAIILFTIIAVNINLKRKNTAQ